MSAVPERLSVLCDQITRHSDMIKEIDTAGAKDQLDAVFVAIRSQDAPDYERLAALLDEIEDACAVIGLVGVTTVSKSYPVLPPGFRAKQDMPPAWVCPTRHCTRVVFQDEADLPPLCVAGGGVAMAESRIVG